MKKIFEYISDESDLLSLQPEEIGGEILLVLNALPQTEAHMFHRGNFVSDQLRERFKGGDKKPIERILVEGGSWLETEGLIARDLEQSEGWIFVTRKGRRLTSKDIIRQYRSSSILKKELLHPRIIEKAWSSYLREEFDTAVSISFKEIEICVRHLANQNHEIIGTDLMRRAFAIPDGHLTPKFLPKGEQEALGHLFAGAIGWFKNPQSHREVQLSSAVYAAQALVFSSHLLFLADMNIPGKIVPTEITSPS